MFVHSLLLLPFSTSAALFCEAFLMFTETNLCRFVPNYLFHLLDNQTLLWKTVRCKQGKVGKTQTVQTFVLQESLQLLNQKHTYLFCGWCLLHVDRHLLLILSIVSGDRGDLFLTF